MSFKVQTLCRICANPFDDSALFRLFDEMDNPVALAEIFLQVSGIAVQVGDTKLPKSCCQRCKDRLQDVEDLRTLCQESDRKLRKMIGEGWKEEESGEEMDIDAIPKVEMLDLEQSYTHWDDTEDKLDSENDQIEHDVDEKSRMPKSQKVDNSQLEPENGDANCFSDDSRDGDPDFIVEATPKKPGRKKKEDVTNSEPKIPKKRGRKPKIRDPDQEAQPKVLKKRGRKPRETELSKKKKTVCCSLCGKVYQSLYALGEHEATHSSEKRFKCEICGMEFVRRNNYKEHLNRHETEGKFKCNECDKAYHKEKYLKQHIQVQHLKERPFQCNLCPKTYPRKSSLFVHVQTFHEKIKKKDFKCEICSRAFRTRRVLERHMNSHNGIKLHQCPHCGNKYEFKAYALQHIAEKHPEMVPNLTRCQYCGLGYSSDGYYRKHIVKRHPEHLEVFDQWMKAKREAELLPAAPSSTSSCSQDVGGYVC